MWAVTSLLRLARLQIIHGRVETRNYGQQVPKLMRFDIKTSAIKITY
jgi:hypothetical protein